MPKYLFEASYDPTGVRGVADEGGTARRYAVDQLFKSVGGELEGFYFAFGDIDVYAFGELPGNEAATAIALNVNQVGTTRVKIVTLLTPEEVDSAAKARVHYQPPRPKEA
jgi:uncharacterized protein with GYD domain